MMNNTEAERIARPLISKICQNNNITVSDLLSNKLERIYSTNRAILVYILRIEKKLTLGQINLMTSIPTSNIAQMIRKVRGWNEVDKEIQMIIKSLV